MRAERAMVVYVAASAVGAAAATLVSLGERASVVVGVAADVRALLRQPLVSLDARRANEQGLFLLLLLRCCYNGAGRFLCVREGKGSIR